MCEIGSFAIRPRQPPFLRPASGLICRTGQRLRTCGRRAVMGMVRGIATFPGVMTPSTLALLVCALSVDRTAVVVGDER